MSTTAQRLQLFSDINHVGLVCTSSVILFFAFVSARALAVTCSQLAGKRDAPIGLYMGILRLVSNCCFIGCHIVTMADFWGFSFTDVVVCAWSQTIATFLYVTGNMCCYLFMYKKQRLVHPLEQPTLIEKGTLLITVAGVPIIAILGA